MLQYCRLQIKTCLEGKNIEDPHSRSRKEDGRALVSWVLTNHWLPQWECSHQITARWWRLFSFVWLKSVDQCWPCKWWTVGVEISERKSSNSTISLFVQQFTIIWARKFLIMLARVNFGKYGKICPKYSHLLFWVELRAIRQSVSPELTSNNAGYLSHCQTCHRCHQVSELFLAASLITDVMIVNV